MKKSVTKQKDPGGIMLLGMLFMGAAYFAFGGAQQLLQRIAYVDSALPAMGHVVTVIQWDKRKGRSTEWQNIRIPIVAFKTLHGKTVDFKLDYDQYYEQGDSLPILYLDRAPHDPIVDTFEFVWQPSIIRLAFGLFLLLISVRFPIWRKQSLWARLKQQK